VTKIGPREEKLCSQRDPSVLESLSSKSEGFGGSEVKLGGFGGFLF